MKSGAHFSQINCANKVASPREISEYSKLLSQPLFQLIITAGSQRRDCGSNFVVWSACNSHLSKLSAQQQLVRAPKKGPSNYYEHHQHCHEHHNNHHHHHPHHHENQRWCATLAFRLKVWPKKLKNQKKEISKKKSK